MRVNLMSVPTKYGDVWIDRGVHHESDLSVVTEIMDRDAYHVQALAVEGYNPSTVLDVGMNHGIFSWLCGKLWPASRIISFEPQLEYMRQAMVNLPDNALPVCLPVLGCPNEEVNEIHEDQRRWRAENHFLCAIDICQLSVSANGNSLLKIDSEGSEMNLLREIKQINGFVRFSVITGEWHFEKSREIVRECLRDDFSTEFTHEGECGHFFARRK